MKDPKIRSTIKRTKQDEQKAKVNIQLVEHQWKPEDPRATRFRKLLDTEYERNPYGIQRVYWEKA